MSEKFKFMLKGAIWIAIIATLIVGGLGLAFGTVIEGSLFAEVAKWAVMDLVIIGILEVFWYTIGQVAYHWTDGYKEKYGKGWFWKGLKEDLAYIKEQTTWKKVLKYVLIYVAFFGVLLLLFWLIG